MRMTNAAKLSANKERKMLELNGQMVAKYGFYFEDDDLAELNIRLKDKGFEETNYEEIAKLWNDSVGKRYDINSKEFVIMEHLECYFVCDCQLEYEDDNERTSNSF
jgi:hypothetical protein